MFSILSQKQSFRGVSQKQTNNVNKGSDNVLVRRILRNSWNNQNLQDMQNNKGRVINRFRAVNNLGDYLCRQNYACGAPNEVIPRRRPGWSVRNIQPICDSTGIKGSSCNPRHVPDSSNYTRYLTERSQLINYNSINV
jgi:hypothetical protein